jgi:ABC-type Zn2+ transport system substrate-binding protein/surface adhesin
MQAFCCDVVLAFMNEGMAMAANNPIMATTIMISTSVKPIRFVFISAILSAIHHRNVILETVQQAMCQA